MRFILLLVACCASLPIALAQPTQCPSKPEIAYEGPCFQEAFPAFFDDFEYTSARTTGSVDSAPAGDLFGMNAWHLREGKELTRAWYRYNRNDLPIPGTVTFDAPSTMLMRLPEGLASADFERSAIIPASFTSGSGTYAWRARLSELWKGQRLRQTLWTMSNNSFVFDRKNAGATTRTMFWSELDFENENHFQGERRNGAFVPDFVTRMSVGNHYGQLWNDDGSQRLGNSGITGLSEGRGKLARNGMARGEAARNAPLLQSWADTWIYFIIYVDAESQTVTYRMLPERPTGELEKLLEETFTVGSAFYPIQPMHPAFSLHWVKPENRLQRPLSLEADWFYYSPVPKLSVGTIREQVEHFRTHGLARLNTTGHATFQPYSSTQPIEPAVRGPRRVACGERATWMIDVHRLGRYHATLRYRILQSDGSYGSWHDVFEPTITLIPRRGQKGIEIDATMQDQWSPEGVIRGAGDRNYPHPENDRAEAHLEATFACAARD